MAWAFPPSGPWEDCAADVLGPLPPVEILLVVVDYFSKYFELGILTSTSRTKIIIEGLKPVFANSLECSMCLKVTMGLNWHQKRLKPSLQGMG